MNKEDSKKKPEEEKDEPEIKKSPEDDKIEEEKELPEEEKEVKQDEESNVAPVAADDEFSLGIEPPTPAGEQTLDDLAGETEKLPTGVEPSRPKSFMDMDQDSITQPALTNSQIPSSGVYARGNRPTKSNKPKTFILLLIALVVIGGSVYLLKGKLFKSGEAQPTPSATPTEATQDTPTPTPTPSIDRSKYTVRILNGTSTSGLAASVSAKLTGLGYKQDKLGNATNSSFTQTQIRVKPSAVAIMDQIIKDLSPDYQGASSASALKETDAADIEVIIGAK